MILLSVVQVEKGVVVVDLCWFLEGPPGVHVEVVVVRGVLRNLLLEYYVVLGLLQNKGTIESKSLSF